MPDQVVVERNHAAIGLGPVGPVLVRIELNFLYKTHPCSFLSSMGGSSSFCHIAAATVAAALAHLLVCDKASHR
jgi:hypothetical protein